MFRKKKPVFPKGRWAKITVSDSSRAECVYGQMSFVIVHYNGDKVIGHEQYHRERERQLREHIPVVWAKDIPCMEKPLNIRYFGRLGFYRLNP